jgi:hypothetical protein
MPRNHVCRYACNNVSQVVVSARRVIDRITPAA